MVCCGAMMRVLPVLEPARRELELCVYCPKLCRAACPVSRAEPNESLIPWGKMSTSYFVARGDVPLDEGHAKLAWACTGCRACTERCDHRNDVAGTLGAARAAMHEKGVAPEGAKRVVAEYPQHAEETREAVARLTKELGAEASKDGIPLLVGCSYAKNVSDVWLDAARATSRLAGAPVRPLSGCCGLPLAMAGDREGFARARASLMAEIGAAKRLIAVDPGCAISLRDPSNDGSKPVEVELFVDLAARELSKLRPLASAPEEPLRYHDPCQLGRGLGRYDEPRAVLTRLLGAPPLEFEESRGMAMCSGGGGLLPETMPENSREIARLRKEDHDGRGGGEIVTACARSLLSFRKAGARASDLATWIARGLGR
jgi:dimethylglycine catabolism B